MSLYVDVKFINLISPKLDRFKKVNEFAWNCRCPFCGDSQKNKYKARGYFYRKGDRFFYTCHNCSYSTTLSKALEHIDLDTYKSYVKEKFYDKTGESLEQPEKFNFSKIEFAKTPAINLETIESLPNNHWVKEYVRSRKIPERYHSILYFAPDFKEFVTDLGSERAINMKEDDPRLVIPFYDAKHNLVAVQGRALRDSKVRYISIKVHDVPFIYGLERVSLFGTVYVVEGPIDSLFLPNAIAIGSSDLPKAMSICDNPVFVFDNEPRNKDVCRIIARTISKGNKVVVWPSDVQEKDINDMVLNGRNVEQLVKDNTYQGLLAEAKFSFWRKS